MTTKYSNQMWTSHESKAALKLSLDDFLDLERSFLFPKNRASWFSALIIRLPLSREPIASSVLEPRSPWRVNRFVARSIPIEMPLVSEQSERWKTTSRRFFSLEDHRDSSRLRVSILSSSLALRSRNLREKPVSFVQNFLNFLVSLSFSLFIVKTINQNIEYELYKWDWKMYLFVLEELCKLKIEMHYIFLSANYICLQRNTARYFEWQLDNVNSNRIKTRLLLNR